LANRYGGGPGQGGLLDPNWNDRNGRKGSDFRERAVSWAAGWPYWGLTQGTSVGISGPYLANDLIEFEGDSLPPGWRLEETVGIRLIREAVLEANSTISIRNRLRALPIQFAWDFGLGWARDIMPSEGHATELRLLDAEGGIVGRIRLHAVELFDGIRPIPRLEVVFERSLGGGVEIVTKETRAIVNKWHTSVIVEDDRVLVEVQEAGCHGACGPYSSMIPKASLGELGEASVFEFPGIVDPGRIVSIAFSVHRPQGEYLSEEATSWADNLRITVDALGR